MWYEIRHSRRHGGCHWVPTGIPSWWHIFLQQGNWQKGAICIEAKLGIEMKYAAAGVPTSPSPKCLFSDSCPSSSIPLSRILGLVAPSTVMTDLRCACLGFDNWITFSKWNYWSQNCTLNKNIRLSMKIDDFIYKCLTLSINCFIFRYLKSTNFLGYWYGAI